MAECRKPSLFKLALYKSAFKLTFSGVFREPEASSSSAASTSPTKSSRATFTPPGSDGAVGLAIAASLCPEPSSGAPAISDAARRSELQSLAHGLAAASFDPNRSALSEDYTFVLQRLDKNTTLARAFYSGEDSGTIREEVVMCRERAVPIDLETPPPPPPFQVAEFLRSCLLCSKALDDKDVYIYKGEKAFCSDECRYQHILDEEKLEAAAAAADAASPGAAPETENLAAFPCGAAAAASPLVVVFELGP